MPKSSAIGQFVILRYDKIYSFARNAGNSKRENPAKLHCKKFAKSSRERNPPNNQAKCAKIFVLTKPTTFLNLILHPYTVEWNGRKTSQTTFLFCKTLILINKSENDSSKNNHFA